MNSTAILQKDAWPAAMALNETDLNLIRCIARGDGAALRDLYTAYGQRLYAYALRLVGDPTLAEDVVQETLVSVWRSAGRYRGEGRLLAWLLGIVHNVAFKALRHQPVPLSAEMEAILTDPGDSPEELVQAGERSHWLRQGLNRLSVEHRDVLELVFYQGLSLQETAQVVGCPTGTVKSRLSYARQYLRGILNRINGEDWR